MGEEYQGKKGVSNIKWMRDRLRCTFPYLINIQIHRDKCASCW